MKVGDVVKVKNIDGPKMTIDELHKVEQETGSNEFIEYASVLWFVGYELNRDSIRLELLEVIEA